MIIKGKEIKAETITMWLNVLSFIVGIIFYFRLEHKYEQPTTVIQQSATKDSVFYLNTQLNYKIADIKRSQDSLIKLLRINQDKQQQAKKNISVIRHQLYSTLKSDWDTLNREQQNAYIKQFISNLKIKNNK
jgi:biopolymer transport protein ExbB/TolQ